MCKAHSGGKKTFSLQVLLISMSVKEHGRSVEVNTPPKSKYLTDCG